MADEMMVRFGAPTLAGIKTGSLFSYQYGTKQKLLEELRALNKELAPKGVRILPLRFHNGRVLLYLYRPAELAKDLGTAPVRRILEENGYRLTKQNPDRCVAQLMARLKECGTFPHEIGLFLSYPPEDVRGFIENRADHYKLSGLWKVYGDVEKARKTFDRYERCTASYCKQWASGVPIGTLAVAG